MPDLAKLEEEALEWIEKAKHDPSRFKNMPKDFADFARDKILEERERIAKAAQDEANKFSQSSRECDNAGNTRGGLIDASAGFALSQFAAAIRQRGERE